MNDSATAKARGTRALVFFTLMAAPFCLPLAVSEFAARDYVHMGLLVVMSALVALLWWAGVRRWGYSGALLTVAAAPVLCILLLGAVFLGLWPTPEGSLGLFVFGYPAWALTLGLISALILGMMERRQLTARAV